MIDIKKGKVSQIMQNLHESVEKRWSRDSEENFQMAQILDEFINDPEIEPRRCAEILNDKFGYSLTGNDVINLNRTRHLSHPGERKEIVEWGRRVESYFEKAMYGDKEAFEKFNSERKIPVIKMFDMKKNPQNYVLLNMLFTDFPEIDIFKDFKKIRNLPVIPCKYLIYDLCDFIGDAYGFETKDKSYKKQNPVENKLSLEQMKRRIEMLEGQLERTNEMMKDLEDDFEDRLSETKVQELTKFFSNLNSDRYGSILDSLLTLRKNIEELKSQKYELPLELNGMFITIKQLIQFTRDNHINPIMKLNSEKTVKASEIEFCNYEGTPFSTSDETKNVKVVSPGWIYSDKEIQISAPYLKEI